jgi:hypothetical protein
MSGNKLVQLLNQYNHEHTVLETGAVLNIRPITTGQMKSILQYEGNDDPAVIDDVLDDIINGCVLTDGFNVDSLTLQDRFDLLIGIRRVSKGDNYTFNIKCPKCKSESVQVVDIDTLITTPFPTEIDTKVVINPALTIHFDYIRRGHQKESTILTTKMGKMTDAQRRSEIATFMYAFGMTKFETTAGIIGDITIEQRKEFLDNLDAKKYEVINDWFIKNNYGTNFKYTVTCKAGDCDFTKEEDIPLTGFFF